MSKAYIIPAELRAAVLQYLAERPIKEAVNLFVAVSNIEPMPEVAATSADAPEE